MLHSQARVIVLIILPEMQLIKKKSTVFPEVHLQYLGGISTGFIGINQKPLCSETAHQPANVQHAVNTHDGFPTGSVHLFLQGCQCCFSISPGISIFIPQEATPASYSAPWGATVGRQKGEWVPLRIALWRPIYLGGFTWREEYGGTSLPQKVKMLLMFYNDTIIVIQKSERGNVSR